MLKYFAISIIRVILTVFYIFPINKRKLFFLTFNFGPFFCNPKYILIDLYDKAPELKYVWGSDLKSLELSKYSNVTVVKQRSLFWIFHIMTAKVIVHNTYLNTYIPFRKEQIMINTWHGGGAYKRVGVEVELRLIEKDYWKSKQISRGFLVQKTTYFISSSKVFSDAIHDDLDIPYSKFLPIGMPRNDLFFKNNSDFISLLKKKINISLDIGIVLYAPTYRGVHSFLESQEIIKIDIEKVKNTLKRKFKKDFLFLFKAHPSFQPVNLYCDESIDVSSYVDMQELLLIADILITDYSSSIWDFSLTKKPCFLFAPDIDLYLSNDRGFYTPIETWPYPLARTNEELCDNIINFDQTVYEAKIKKHHEDLGSYEQGVATHKVTELLQEIFEKL